MHAVTEDAENLILLNQYIFVHMIPYSGTPYT
jgi:hypothetical protein